jgi:hypothetical protein
MAMAHKAPMDHYRRTNYVSLHAVEQLRQRIGNKHELFHRDNNDVSNAIDEAVNIGIKKDNIEKFDYDGKPNLGVDISDFFGFPLRAVLAKNEKKDSPYRAAVVTILTMDMRLKKDTKSGASIGDAISPELQAALRAAVAGEQAATVEPQPPSGPSAPLRAAPARSVVEAKPSKISTRDVSADRRLITYVKDNDTALTVEEFAAPGDLRNRIFELHQKGRPLGEITVWKPSRASIAIALDFEEG